MKNKRVICNAKDYTYLTFGNTYKVEEEGENCFCVKDDDGDSSWYYKDSFSVVKEEPTPKDNKVLLYQFDSVGMSSSIPPLVTLKGFDLIEGKDSKKFHELMNQIKFECLKMDVSFEGNIYKIEPI